MNVSRVISISQAQWKGVLDVLTQFPSDALLSPHVRRYLAMDRWKSSSHTINLHEESSAGVTPGAIKHNRKELDQSIFGSFTRTLRLINPLAALDPVYSRAADLKVLSIGPRTEMEIFHLVGIGFKPENIIAVDLISSSPLIETGDMHNLQYADSSFDVVISSWVLNYSSDPQRVIDEMVRVCKKGGLVAIGLTYNPDVAVNDVDNSESIVGSMHKSVDELKSRFGRKLDRIYFQHEPDDVGKKGPVMLVARTSDESN